MCLFGGVRHKTVLLANVQRSYICLGLSLILTPLLLYVLFVRSAWPISICKTCYQFTSIMFSLEGRCSEYKP